MIRLWNRVGVFRVLSISMLLVGLLGGLVLSDRQTQQQRNTAQTADPGTGRDDLRALEQDLIDHRDAQGKAADAANQAADRAKQAEDESRKKSPASRSERGTPGAPVGPIPPDCASITGTQAANRQVGCTLLIAAGFKMNPEWGCLDPLWKKESGWNHKARNPSSGAGGIPQALPATKMASAGSDWQTNPATQIRWGLGYIKGRYGTPCKAWAHSQSTGWY